MVSQLEAKLGVLSKMLFLSRVVEAYAIDCYGYLLAKGGVVEVEVEMFDLAVVKPFLAESRVT